jgi:pyrroloquinoline quinone biosynthesis protein E
MKPRLSPKARVRRDPRDGAAVLLGPERGLRLSDTAAATLALCDGTRTVEAIVEALLAQYKGAPRDRVDHDVRVLLGDLRARVLLEGFEGAAPRADVALDDGEAAPAASPGDATPYTLVAELTHRCPLACPYCSNPQKLTGAHDELRTADWTRVFDEAAALGVMQAHLSGGEPLARSDLEAIAAHARSLDLYVNLVTSGVPLDRARLDRLAPSIDHVQLSIQDADGASSDRIAGMAAFDAKLRVARWVKEAGLPLTLNVVMHRENLDRVEAVIAMAEELRADRLELANVQFISWANANADALLPTRAQIEHAREVAHAAKKRLEGRMQLVFVLPDWHAGRPRACMDGWGRRFVVVAPDGAVLPCHAARSLPLAFESVRDRSLAAAWAEAPGMRTFRGDAWLPEPCRSCDRKTIDYGGCRCQAFALTGDTHATDPACDLAPQHALVRAARERAEQASPHTFIYRGR